MKTLTSSAESSSGAATQTRTIPSFSKRAPRAFTQKRASPSRRTGPDDGLEDVMQPEAASWQACGVVRRPGASAGLAASRRPRQGPSAPGPPAPAGAPPTGTGGSLLVGERDSSLAPSSPELPPKTESHPSDRVAW